MQSNLTEAIQEHYDLASPYYEKLWGKHLHHGYYRTGEESKEEAAENLIEFLVERAGIREGARQGTRLNSRSEEHTSELQSRQYLVCRLLLEKKKTKQ